MFTEIVKGFKLTQFYGIFYRRKQHFSIQLNYFYRFIFFKFTHTLLQRLSYDVLCIHLKYVEEFFHNFGPTQIMTDICFQTLKAVYLE